MAEWPTHKDFIFAHVKFLTADEQQQLNTTEQAKVKKKRLHDLITGDQNSSDDKIKKFDFFQQINNKYHWHNVGNIKDPQKKSDAEKENQLIDDLQKAFGYDDFVSSPQDEQWYKDFKASNGGNDWNIKILSEKLNI